jgi:phosphoribosylanthranilate isomerase
VARYAHRGRFFLITYLDHAEDIVALSRKIGVNMVQLHGKIAAGELRRLRALAPDFHILKSLIVRGDNEAALHQDVERFAPLVDGFITDSFDAVTGASGATGKTHDWSISRKLVKASPKPVILAGGLKRADLTARFVAEARAAFTENRPASD